MCIRDSRNGAQFPRFEGDKAAAFINNRARLSMEYKRSDLSMKISAQHVGSDPFPHLPVHFSSPISLPDLLDEKLSGDVHLQTYLHLSLIHI